MPSTALLLLACARPPAECDAPRMVGWEPLVEDEVRLDAASAPWEAVGSTRIAEATEDCTGDACLGVVGEAARAPVVLNRAVAHRLEGSIRSEAGIRVSVLGEDGEVVAVEAAAGEAEISTEFVPPRGGQAHVVLEPLGGGAATVHHLKVRGETWSTVDDAPVAPLLLGFVVHVEQDDSFVESEDRWSARARVIEGLSATLAAHGARLGFQPHATFVRGAAIWDATWVDARTQEGTGWSVHIHGEDDGDDLEVAVREGRDAFRGVDVEVGDVNGGFRTADWALLREVGYQSLSAYKDPDTQAGLALAYAQPWRPPDGAGTENPDAFATHDAAGPLVYLPGAPVREVDHARVPDFSSRVLSQALAHTRTGFVNTWYFVLHVDDFGPSDEDGRDAYLADGSLEGDLAEWDRALADVIDPLVSDGLVEYATPTQMARAWLDWEEACR
ncbi:MAG: hypothetical protein ACOZNI_34905 [Myxococcota bacterium]